MATVGTIAFFIQRKDDARGRSKDDVINIAPAEHGLYSVTYRSEAEPQLGNRQMILSEFDTLRYVQSMMDMLVLDNDPFEFVQISMPSMPSTVHRTELLADQNLRNNIFTAMKITMHSWPHRKATIRRRPSHTSSYATPQNAIPPSEPADLYQQRREAIRQHLRFDESE